MNQQEQRQHGAAEPPRTEKTPSALQRCVAAGAASVVSAFVVNPFDVVKTRMQTHSAASTSNSPLEFCSHPAFTFVRADRPSRLWQHSPHALRSVVVWHEGHLVACPSCHTLPCDFQAAPSPAIVTSARASMFGTFRQIIRQEGLPALYRGLDSSLLMSVPTVAVYFPLYDHILSKVSHLGMYGPLVSGVLSRTAALVLTAPIELVRTRQQAMTRTHSSNPTGPSAWQTLKLLSSEVASSVVPATASGNSRNSSNSLSTALSKLRSIPKLWTGFAVTLARDVPFSAMYWSLVEPIRGTLLQSPQDGTTASTSATRPASQILVANILAGSVAGAAAGAATTPFDVIKTRLQTADSSTRALQQQQGMWVQLRKIWQVEGARGLFLGAGPRSFKAAPACAIVISSYEVLKATLEV